MQCSSLDLTLYVLQRLFSRQIPVADVRFTVEQGREIATYPTDKPYPSALLLAFPIQQPLHVVVAQDVASSLCVVITAYRPDPALWDSTFTQKLR